MSVTKTLPKPNTVKQTTKIMLEVDNTLYYSIKGKADIDTQKDGHKKTIAEKMCEMLKAENVRQDLKLKK